MKAIACSFSALMAIAAVASPAHADSQLSSRSVNELVSGDGASYLDAAKRILEDGDLRASIVGAAADATFTADNFERLAVEAALAARAQDPALVETLGDLESLEPSTYLRQRRQIPAAGRELARKKLPIGALLEAYLWPDAHFEMRGADAYPPSYREQVPEFQAMEKRAFEEAVLMALADSRHPAAAFALLRELYNEQGGHRELAAVLLGRCDAAVAREPLRLVTASKRASYGLREAAIVGLGKLRDAKATDALAKIAEDVEATSQLRKAAIIALGQSASAWALKEVAEADATTIRGIARSTLVRLLPQVAGTDLADAVKTSLILLEDPKVLDALEAMQADPSLSSTARGDILNAKRGLQRAIRRQTR